MTKEPAAGIFHGLQAEWTALCEDASVQAAVADWLRTDGLADDVAAMTDSWVRGLGPRHVLAAVAPRGGAVADRPSRRGSARPIAACGRPWPIGHAGRADRGSGDASRRAAHDPRTGPPLRWPVLQRRRPHGHRRPFRDSPAPAGSTNAPVAPQRTSPSTRSAGSAASSLQTTEPAGDALLMDVIDPALSPAAHAHAREVHAAATAVGLEAAPVTVEEFDAARLELLELLLEAMEAGHLPADDARTISTYYSDRSLPDQNAAAAAGVSQPAWRRRRSRAVGRLKNAVAPRPSAPPDHTAPTTPNRRTAMPPDPPGLDRHEEHVTRAHRLLIDLGAALVHQPFDIATHDRLRDFLSRDATGVLASLEELQRRPETDLRARIAELAGHRLFSTGGQA